MKKLMFAFLALALLVTPACQNLEGLSVATTDCLINPEDISSDKVLVIPSEDLPREIAESEKLEGKKVIIAPTEILKPECVKVEIPNPSTDLWGWLLGTLGVAAGVASIWIPKLALLEGFFALLSRRKREHYVAAAKAVVPYDGNVDMKSAVSSLAKALGILHTNSATKKPTDGGGSTPQAAA